MNPGIPKSALWRNRDFVLLWTGQVVSTVGTRVSAVAFPLLVLAVTGSPAQAGLVGFAQGLPYVLVYLPAGALVDRWDRRRTMLAADACRAVAIGSVAIAVVADSVTLPHLMVVGFIEGSLFIFFQLAENAALPHVVPRAQLPTALASNQARELGADLAGGPIGGLLFAVGAALPFVFDTVSYAVSFAALLFIRPRLQGDRKKGTTRGLLVEVAEGVRWMVRQRLLRTLVLLVGVINFAVAVLFLALIVRARELGASAEMTGLVLGLYGAGAVVGALVAPWMYRHVAPRVLLIGALWWWVVTTAALLSAPSAAVLGLVAGAGALPGPAFNVVVGAYRYALIPDRLQARAVGVSRLVAWGTVPLGSLLGGLLAESVGASRTLLALTVAMLAIAIAGSAAPVVRAAPRPETLTADDPAPPQAGRS
jgi:MFS family permease